MTVQPVVASRQARLAYWAREGPAGNRADAERAADLAYNAAIANGPASFREAYKLRPVDEPQPVLDA